MSSLNKQQAVLGIMILLDYRDSVSLDEDIAEQSIGHDRVWS